MRLEGTFTSGQNVYATAVVRGPNNLISGGRNAFVSLAPSATARVVEISNSALIDIAGSASADVIGGAINFFAQSPGATATVTATEGDSYLGANGAGTNIEMHFNGDNGDYQFAGVGGSAMARLYGTSISAEVDSQGQATLYGSGALCHAVSVSKRSDSPIPRRSR